jgi:DNA integrity scanning protein DisA with diadenylate cyclase activity
MLEFIRQIRWQDALDVGIITFLVYRALQIVRGSRAMQMIIGLAVILVAYVSSRALGLFTLNWILDYSGHYRHLSKRHSARVNPGRNHAAFYRR